MTGIFSQGTSSDRTWWRESVVYQIYTHSFKDSSGNGIGDLKGILSKLDYLYDLGIDVILLSPIYDSPLADMGYDVRDEKKILDAYGTMDDWKRLLDRVHERKMRLIMDFVVNHTSDEHAFFLESRSSRHNPKHDWYYWKDPKFNEKGERIPPNNWESTFGGPAWTWEDHRGQYYLHLFTPKQPDLNWDNPAVRNAVHDILRWWLDQGVDGARLGVINCISKHSGLPDAPITNPGSLVQPAGEKYIDGPHVHDYVKEINQKVFKDYDIMTVGEMSGDLEFYEAMKYVAKDRKELSMVFHFAHLKVDEGPKGVWDLRQWKLSEFKDRIHKWQQYLGGSRAWTAVFFQNHDQPRTISRFLSDDPKYRAISAKMGAILQFSLSGTPFIFQGEELAMADPKDWTIEDYKDVGTRNFYRAEIERRGSSKEVIDNVMYKIYKKARDNSRTPMQWNASKHAGFTNGEPWLKVNNDYKDWNADQQIKDPDSVWNFYKTMIHKRKTHPSLFYGDFAPIDADDEKIIAYVRSQGNFGSLTVLNWSAEPSKFEVPEEIILSDSILAIGNYKGSNRHLSRVLDLEPYEARIYTVASSRS